MGDESLQSIIEEYYNKHRSDFSLENAPFTILKELYEYDKVGKLTPESKIFLTCKNCVHHISEIVFMVFIDKETIHNSIQNELTLIHKEIVDNSIQISRFDSIEEKIDILNRQNQLVDIRGEFELISKQMITDTEIISNLQVENKEHITTEIGLLSTKMSTFDDRLDAINGRFDKFDSQLPGIQNEFGVLNDKIDIFNGEIDKLKDLIFMSEERIKQNQYRRTGQLHSHINHLQEIVEREENEDIPVQHLDISEEKLADIIKKLLPDIVSEQLRTIKQNVKTLAKNTEMINENIKILDKKL